MDHKPIFELQIMLDDAKGKVTVGAPYVHYKYPDKRYVVTGLSIWEPTDEVVVRYSPEDKPQIEFVRPLSEWLQALEWDSRTVTRFTKVASDTSTS